LSGTVPLTQPVECKKNVPSGTIVINRPDKRNALSRHCMLQIRQALEDFHQERSVRAVILIGAGKAFCSGMDLQEMQETNNEPDPQAQWHEDTQQYKQLVEVMLRFPKPLIAAVNGPAVAGGAGLVLACDLVVAAKSATLGLPEPQRGLVAGLVAPLLNFRLGASRAANMLLQARHFSAEEALQMGAFHELVDDELVWARAHELAQQATQSAPESLQLTKQMLNETIGEHLFMQLNLGAAASAAARTTDAAREGLQAFLEKRQPDWK
jgi:methylglutaconyl-CoA hydratase